MKHHFEPFNSKYMAGCQQPFLVQNGWWQPVVSSHFWSKTAGDNRLSAAVAFKLLWGCMHVTIEYDACTLAFVLECNF